MLRSTESKKKKKPIHLGCEWQIGSVGGCQRVRGTATGWQRDGSAAVQKRNL